MKKGLLSNNQLKLIALVCMTVDHVGMVFFAQNMLLRLIGRLAMPIYGYMIAEGCCYTGNRRKYLKNLVVMAVLCQLVYLVAEGSLYQGIFVTFSLSIALIYLVEWVSQTPKALHWCYLALAVIALWVLTEGIPAWDRATDYGVDYGFFGALLPVLVYLAQGRRAKLVAAGLCLCGVSCVGWAGQWYSLLALPLLALYSGQRGKWRVKWFFYWYYPAHLAVIYLIFFFYK